MTMPHIIHWKGQMTIRVAALSARDLLEALSNHVRVVVDTTELRSIDVSHLQILIAAMRFAGSLGSRLEVSTSPGGPFDEALQRRGLVNATDAARLLGNRGSWAVRHKSSDAAAA